MLSVNNTPPFIRALAHIDELIQGMSKTQKLRVTAQGKRLVLANIAQ